MPSKPIGAEERSQRKRERAAKREARVLDLKAKAAARAHALGFDVDEVAEALWGGKCIADMRRELIVALKDEDHLTWSDIAKAIDRDHATVIRSYGIAKRDA